MHAPKTHTLQAHQLASQLERQYGLVKQQGKAVGIFSTADTKAEMPSASVPEQSDILISKCNRQSLFCVVFVAVVVCVCMPGIGDLYFSPNS